MSNQADQKAVTALVDSGAIVKLGKSGNALMVDFRQVASQVTNQTLSHLQSLNSIREINLDGAAISDASLAYLKHLVKLTTLDLQRTTVTDAALDQVSSLPALKLLLLTGSNVSRERVNELRKQMLKTRIVYI